MVRGGYWSLCSGLAAVALLKGGTGKVTGEECKGTGRVILFLTSLWILEFLRN